MTKQNTTKTQNKNTTKTTSSMLFLSMYESLPAESRARVARRIIYLVNKS